MNKQQLAARIWESANRMRSKIEANEYKDYILGFLFYKFLSDKEERYLKDNDWTDEYLPELTEDDTETVEMVKNNLGYFIAYKSFFSTWIASGADFSVADVTDAINAFNANISENHRKIFAGIFRTLETGLAKLGESAGARTKAIRDLIYLIKDIPTDSRQDYDVLGFIYEYLIGNFAANAGKKAGEFYTPHEVSVLMSEIVAHHLKDLERIKIYDPTSGSGSLLINIGKSASRYLRKENQIDYYAQELKENTYNLTRMNLVMRGILPGNLYTRNGDTLEDDWPYFEDNDPVNTYAPLYVDAVVSNPPYSQVWNPEGKESDPRYSSFGLAPKSKADFAFLLHDLYHLKPGGIMTIVLPHGVLFRGGEEGNIRKALVERNHIDAIVGLPPNIFFGTGIPTIVMVLKQQRENTDILFVDASKGFAKQGNSNVLRARDIKKIVDTVVGRKTTEKYSRVVSREEIRENDHNLNIPRYVDSSDEEEQLDLWTTIFGGISEDELAGLHEYWEAMPGLKEALFESQDGAHYEVHVDDLAEAAASHPDVASFRESILEKFKSFPDFLEKTLLDGLIDQTKDNGADASGQSPASTVWTEERISAELFKLMEGMPLLDPYEAYQILDDHWQPIAEDLEVLATEGFEATRRVEPYMVSRKRGSTEEEVQEGWEGRLLPFELIQKTHLPEKLAEIENEKAKLAGYADNYAELLDELGEEAREEAFVKEDGFVATEVKKALKGYGLDDETRKLLLKVDRLIKEEKALKKTLKDHEAVLSNATRRAIENLKDEEILDLLRRKWIVPLVEELNALPQKSINTLVLKLEELREKNSTTLASIDKEIAETEAELCQMIDELTGSESDMQALKELKRLLGE